jgi:hypothetical protein
MERTANDPESKHLDQPYPTTEPDVTPRREGGDDSVAESSPQDTRADEKVIVNEQKGNTSSPIMDSTHEKDRAKTGAN